MKNHQQSQISNEFSEERLQRARTALTSAIADAAAQRTLEEPLSARLAMLATNAPRDDLDREVITEQIEWLSGAMSYFNALHGAKRLETDFVRMTFSFGEDSPGLICAVVDATKRDISLIEHRLTAAVQAGVLDEGQKDEILAKPFLNHQAADALEAFSAINPRKDGGG